MSLATAIGYLSGFNITGGIVGEETPSAAATTVEVSFPKQGRLGVKLATKKRSSEDKAKVVVAGFPRHPEGGMGQVEASGRVMIGDELLMVKLE
jgi:hypothetical protein